jgi:hypothetical protein
MYKTHIKLQPAEGPTKFTFTSYTDQFKYDAKRGNFDTDKMWYTELNKWTDHLTDIDKAELIELQKKLQRKFVSDDRMKVKHRGWKCQRKDNDCEVPIQMRNFMLVLDKEIRKKLKESLDIPQRSSVIDVVEDFKRKGLVKHLQRFVLFCGDIRQNIHHIVQFIKFYVDNKDVISKSFTPTSSTPVNDMPKIRNMPLENTEDDDAFKKAMKLVQSYMAWAMSFLEPYMAWGMSFLEPAEVEPAEGRFLSAEPGAHAPLLAHMLFGNPVEYIFTSLLGLVETFVGFSVIVIAILCLVAWLCPPEPTSQTPEPTSQTHNDMEQWIQEEQHMQQRRRVHQQRRRVHESMRDDLLKKYENSPEYAALSKKYYGVIPLSELKKLAVNAVTVTEKMEKTLEKCAYFWDGTCSICLREMEHANNVKCCNCGHSFHKNCINKWLPTAKTCPICRQPCGEGLVLGKIGETLKTLVAKKDELEKAKTKREAEKREQQRDEQKKKDELEKAKTKREAEKREQQRDEQKKKEIEKAKTKREAEKREQQRDEQKKKEIEKAKTEEKKDDSDSDYDPEDDWARRKGYLY